MHLFIKDSIFHIVWPNSGPRFSDIFSISGNALMTRFSSIVISCENAHNDSVSFCGSRCTFSLTIQFFIIFGLTLGPHSGNALMNHFFSIVISGDQAKKLLCEGFADPMHLFIKNSIFRNFWPNFGPRF